MRVPDVVLRSVAFIGEATHEDSVGLGGDLRGTGFFVCIPFASPELQNKRLGFFVTAGHVARDLSDAPMYFLVNKRGGGVTGIQSLIDDWIVHPTDRTADVAVVPVALNKEADIKCISMTEDFVRPFDLKDNVGVGDEVFITGLFTEAPGQTRVMPIVRHGNIAMLPDQQIQTDMGYADVYLVEARSIGGLSGSPVFVRSANYGNEGLESARGIKLLGLMHGHWAIDEAEINNPTITHNRQRGVNLGIGIVVPADKIWETIKSPQLTEWRTNVEKDLVEQRRKNVPSMDSARPKAKSTEDEQTITKEEFEDALKKASRKTSISASDKPQK